MKILPGLFAAAFVLFSPHAFAQGSPQAISVSVGDTPIAVSIPGGFTRVLPEHDLLMKIGLQITPPENRLLAHFVEASDLRSYTSGKAGSFRRYFLVQTFRAGENQALSAAEFDKIRSVIRTNQAEMLKKTEPRLAELARQLEKDWAPEGSGIAFRMGDLVPLGVLEEGPGFINFGALIGTQVKSPTAVRDLTVISISSIALVKNKVLFLYTYNTLESPKDLDWAKQASAAWTRDVLSANK